MSVATSDLLGRLLALDAGERRDLMARDTDPATRITELLDEAERILAQDLTRGEAATECVRDAVGGVDDPALQSRVYRVHARALAMSNRYLDALAEAERAIDAADRANAPVESGRARMVMLHANARLGRHAPAIECGKEARRVFLAAGDTTLAAKADANLGEAHRLAHDPAAALECFDRAFDVLGRDALAAAPLENNRAQALLDLNRFEDAEQSFRRALASFETGGIGIGVAIVQGNLGDLMSRQGRLEAALTHFEQARRHFEQSGSAGDLSRLEAEHAEALAGAGCLEDAVDTFRRALPELRRHEMTGDAARAGIGLGRALVRLGRLDDAETALREVARDHADVVDGGLVNLRLAQGELALVTGRLEIARDHLDEALRRVGARPAHAALIRHVLAEACVADGQYEAAEHHLDTAIHAAESLDLAPLAADLFHTRARLRFAQSLPEMALSDLRTALDRIERLRGSLQAERFRSAFVGRRASVYEDLVRALVDRGAPDDLEEAFATVEKAKGRSLLDLVAGAIDGAITVPEDDDPGAGSLVARIVALRRRLNALYSRVPGLGAESAAAVRAWRERVHETERALQRHEDRLSSTVGAGGIFARSIEVADLQKTLPDDVAVVEFYVANDEIMAFVIERQHLSVHRGLDQRDTLKDAKERLRFQLDRTMAHGDGTTVDDSLVRDTQRELHELYRRLFAPLESTIAGARHIVFVPHGPLHGLPLHALFDGDSYLLERFAVSFIPSASLLCHLETGAHRGATPSVLLMGAADEVAPAIEDEVRAIARTLPSAQCAIGEEATTTRLRDDGGAHDVIHLACHGRFSTVSPLSSALRLADRWMTVRELYELKLNGALVVLSGCDTGRTVIDHGDELIGLERGFFAAGASALVMSLWTLHDQSAQLLMSDAYARWIAGENSAKVGSASNPTRFALSLRESQTTLMKACPHPAYWAPFVMVGRSW